MADKRKRHKESDVQATPEQEHENRKQHKKFEAALEPSEIEDSDSLARKKQHERKERKYLKKLRKQKKKIDELSNRLKEMTEIVKKLQKNSDPLEISLKEKETPKKECCFESKDGDLLNRKSIFVKGFSCSFPKEEIKSALKKHFSSCGLVSNIFVPFHCKTGSPMGFAFINMAKDVEKALKLDGSCLGGEILFVTMAIKRDEYYGYENHDGCERCHSAAVKREAKLFSERFIISPYNVTITPRRE